MHRRVKATPQLSATETASLARFVALVALHKEETGTRIAQARESVGLTQQEAADLVGVDKRTVQRYEAGDIGRMQNLQSLASAYGLTLEQLLGEAALPERPMLIRDRLNQLETKVDRLLELLEGEVNVDAEIAQLEADEKASLSQFAPSDDPSAQQPHEAGDR